MVLSGQSYLELRHVGTEWKQHMKWSDVHVKIPSAPVSLKLDKMHKRAWELE
jgi:hypothetical protein